MSFIYPKLWGRKRTYIKEKVKSRDKCTCSEIPYDPVDMTASILAIIRIRRLVDLIQEWDGPQAGISARGLHTFLYYLCNLSLISSTG